MERNHRVVIFFAVLYVIISHLNAHIYKNQQIAKSPNETSVEYKKYTKATEEYLETVEKRLSSVERKIASVNYEKSEEPQELMYQLLCQNDEALHYFIESLRIFELDYGLENSRKIGRWQMSHIDMTTYEHPTLLDKNSWLEDVSFRRTNGVEYYSKLHELTSRFFTDEIGITMFYRCDNGNWLVSPINWYISKTTVCFNYAKPSGDASFALFDYSTL